MMYLQKINILNFKNYNEAELYFSEKVNCFVGNNGAGKTNLLDAIHYLTLCKSFFNPIDSQQIRYGEDFFMLQATFLKNDANEVVYCGVKKNKKKQFKRNAKEYQRLADHVGLFPLVMISPNDIGLIIDGSEERRKFIDNVISQTDTAYLDTLISYNKSLAGRNALLRSFAERGNFDVDLLDVFDEQLQQYGQVIYEKRKLFLADFTQVFDEHYRFISDGAETVELNYATQLDETGFAEGLKSAQHRDRMLQRSTFGIHKDDLLFSIQDHPLKKFGSQGQQKSFLIALKLAKYSYLDKQKGFKPILLLDDIFDKLDHHRIKKLMEMVAHDDFGQIFITDTESERLEGIFNSIALPIRVFEVHNGRATERDNRLEI